MLRQVKDKIKDWWQGIKDQNLLLHPFHTFQIGIASIIAQSQSEHDYAIVYGSVWGPKVYVLTKWVGAILTALATVGRSPLSEIDNPKKEREEHA